MTSKATKNDGRRFDVVFSPLSMSSFFRRFQRRRFLSCSSSLSTSSFLVSFYVGVFCRNFDVAVFRRSPCRRFSPLSTSSFFMSLSPSSLFRRFRRSHFFVAYDIVVFRCCFLRHFRRRRFSSISTPCFCFRRFRCRFFIVVFDVVVFSLIWDVDERNDIKSDKKRWRRKRWKRRRRRNAATLWSTHRI